jgi:hypothetical protein
MKFLKIIPAPARSKDRPPGCARRRANATSSLAMGTVRQRSHLRPQPSRFGR